MGTHKRAIVKQPAGWNKKYFSKEDKVAATIIGVFVHKLSTYANEWEKIKRPRIMISTLRITASFADRVLRMMLSSLDPRERDRIIRDLDEYHVFALNKQETRARRAEIEYQESIIEVEKDDFSLMLEEITDVKCRNCLRKPSTCKLRELLWKYDAEPFDPCAEHGCQYFFTDYKEVV